MTPTLATAWLIVRLDGQRFAFSSWDKPFSYSIDGVNTDTYQPVNSFSGSATVSKTDLSVGNQTVTGLISTALSERDLAGGLFDNARIKSFWINPNNPGYGIVPLMGGRLGEFVFHNVQFETEVRSPLQVLQQPFGRYFTLECYTQYGDEFCSLIRRSVPWRPNFKFTSRTARTPIVRPRASWTGLWYQSNTTSGWSGATEPNWPTSVGGTVGDGEIVWTAVSVPGRGGTVTGVFNRGTFADTSLTDATGYWQYGQVYWVTGANQWLAMEIQGFTQGGIVQLLEGMVENIQVGDQYVIQDGCAKTRTACIAKGNLLNFRGFADMPTEDRAMVTPNVTSPDPNQNQNTGGGGGS
jgi:hypothetical protein